MQPLLITDTPEEELLTVAELAKKWHTNRRMIVRLIDGGRLTHCDLTPDGNERRTGLRIPVSAANEYIARNTVAARTSAA